MHLISPFRLVFIFIAISLMGVLCIPYLDIDLLPKEKSNTLVIQTYLRNASPQIVESSLTQILENAFSGLPSIATIKSKSKYNQSEIRLEFVTGTDMEFAQFEVTSIIRRLYRSLPDQATYPIMTREAKNENETNNLEKPILIYAINAPEVPFSIKEKANDFFRKELTDWSDLKEIRISGTEDLQCAVKIDKEKCRAYSVSIDDIQSQLLNYARVQYPGSVSENNGKRFFLKISSQAMNLQSLENLLIRPGLALKEVADIQLEEIPVTGYFRVNGKNSIRMMLFSREGANRIVLADAIKSKIEKIKYALPPGYDVRLEQDDTKFFK